MTKTEALILAQPHLRPRLGFGTPEAWDTVIAETLVRVIELEKRTGLNVTIDQIKEKFGDLRFYAEINDRSPAGPIALVPGGPGSVGVLRFQSGVAPGTPSAALRQIIDDAEAKVRTLCAECGREGAELRNQSGYIVRLCNAHAKGAPALKQTKV